FVPSGRVAGYRASGCIRYLHPYLRQA
ncbi:dctM-like transporters family protein, partial [Vibrio parahaemolyticus V-223/04]